MHIARLFQLCFQFTTPSGRWSHEQVKILLRYPPKSPWVSHNLSITHSRTRILVHSYRTRIAQRFVGTIRAASGMVRVRNGSHEDFVRKVLGVN
jgi:hypothetical protein